MQPSQWIFYSAVVIFTIVAAVSDLRTRRLPNWLTVPTLVAGLLFHTITGGFSGLGMSLAGFATGFGILLVLWLIGGGGGGDVKLMGALGAWLGPVSTLIVFLLSTVFAVIGSVGIALSDVFTKGISGAKRRFAAARSSHQPRRRKKGRGRKATLAPVPKRRLMPYALPVALGTWLVLAWQVIRLNQ